MPGLPVFVSGLDFGEGPRWHDGRLWFSDFHQPTVSSVGDDGVRVTELELDDYPSGLGWLPDGRLLVVAMQSRRVLRVEADGAVVAATDAGWEHAVGALVAADLIAGERVAPREALRVDGRDRDGRVRCEVAEVVAERRSGSGRPMRDLARERATSG